MINETDCLQSIKKRQCYTNRGEAGYAQDFSGKITLPANNIDFIFNGKVYPNPYNELDCIVFLKSGIVLITENSYEVVRAQYDAET